MTWIEKAMQLSDDYAKKLGATVLQKPGASYEDMKREAALARITLMSFLEAAKPAQVPHDGLTQ